MINAVMKMQLVEQTLKAIKGWFYSNDKGRPLDFLIGIVLLVIFIVFTRNIIGPRYTFALFPDNEMFLAPLFSHMSMAIRHGEWPFWMPTVVGGVPLYSLPQTSVLYPFHLLGLNIYDGTLESIRSIHLISLAHLLLFEVSTYLLLRKLDISRVASIAGAVIIVFSANTLGIIKWANIFEAYAWLPLYLLGLFSFLQTPVSRKAIFMAVFAMVMLIYACFGQALIHAVVLTAVIVLFHTVRLLRLKETTRLREGLFVLCGVTLIALLLASPVLMPVLITFKDSIRWITEPFPPVLGYQRIPFAAFLTDQLKISDLPGVLFRIANTRAIGSEYVGLLTILLATVAYSKERRNWVVLPMVVVAIYSLASATGSNLGLAYINYYVPIVNKIREPSYFLFLFALATGILAAFGIDRLGQLVEQPGGNRRIYWVTSVVVGVGLFFAILAWPQVGKHTVIIYPIIVTMIMIVITAFITSCTFPSRGRVIVTGWSVAVVVTQFIAVPWLSPTLANSDYLRKKKINLDIALERVAEIDPTHEYRVIFEGLINKQEAAMQASFHGIRTLNSYVNPLPIRQFEQMYNHGPRKDKYLKALGAKYLLCQECGEEALSGYNFLEDVAGYSIYETAEALPHTYIAHAVDGEFKDVWDFAAKTNTMDLTRRPLYIEHGTWQSGVKENLHGADPCIKEITRSELNLKQIVVNCNAPGILVLNEFFNSDWKVSVDGVGKKVLNVNGNQLGVPFSAGSHVIEFRYAPKIMQFAFALALLGGVVLILFLWFVRRIEINRACLSEPSKN